jgi:hypothetical protein
LLAPVASAGEAVSVGRLGRERRASQVGELCRGLGTVKGTGDAVEGRAPSPSRAGFNPLDRRRRQLGGRGELALGESRITA